MKQFLGSWSPPQSKPVKSKAPNDAAKSIPFPVEHLVSIVRLWDPAGSSALLTITAFRISGKHSELSALSTTMLLLQQTGPWNNISGPPGVSSKTVTDTEELLSGAPLSTQT